MPWNRRPLENKTGKWKNGLSFGTWNIRTLFKPGAVQCLVEETERYKLGEVALQEIRWNDKGMLDTIFYGECNKHHQFGTGFTVHINLVPSVKEFKSINPRISMLTIEAQYFDITFVNGHATTEEKMQEEKDEFYDNLEHTLNRIPQSRIRIVLGDIKTFN